MDQCLQKQNCRKQINRTTKATVSLHNIPTVVNYLFTRMQTKLVRGILLILGFLSLSLGLLGIFLPLLPTTPFLLLAAWLFFRSSPKAYHWLLNNKFYGEYIKAFMVHKAIPLKAKIVSITLLWVTITSSALFLISIFWIKLLLFSIALGVTFHILSYKTLKED